MKKLLVLLCITIGVTSNSSCTRSISPSVVAENQSMLQSDGFKVGTFDDGAELRRWQIETGTLVAPHFVYRILPRNGQKEPNVTTVNAGQGKMNGVYVVIDGVEYTPVIEKIP